MTDVVDAAVLGAFSFSFSSEDFKACKDALEAGGIEAVCLGGWLVLVVVVVVVALEVTGVVATETFSGDTFTAVSALLGASIAKWLRDYENKG